jgi:hypothetical protein
MWDLPHLVLIQKARHALRAGNLDEAYAIATDEKLADHRKRQTLLEDMVAPFLDRARRHLDAGRAEEAAADVERARVAGGNRPEVVEVRERALEALRRMRRARDDERKVLASVEGHLARAEVAAGAERLEAAPAGAPKAADLRRRIERVQKDAVEARAQAERHLADGDVLGAVEAAGLAHSLAKDDAATAEVALRAGREGESALVAAIRDGNIAIARALFEKLEGLARLLPARDRWREALDLCDKAARSVVAGDWARGRVALKRLQGLVPDALWVMASEEKLRAVEDALLDIRSGPLGQPISAGARSAPGAARRDPAAPARAGTTVHSPRPAPPRPGAPARSVIWVDGVGSYLILTGDRITIGRPSTSAKPDIALLAELEGIHAEILRVAEDYFLVPRGPVHVAGKPVKRHLLADGDEFVLGARSRLTFRLPTSLSPTAILELGPGLRLDGDVRKVVLLDGHLIIGPGKGCHIETGRAEGRVIISAGADGFRCRAEDALLVDGSPVAADEPVPFGAHVEAGPLTFTLTRGDGQGGSP